MASLTTARQEFAQEVERAVPADDSLRPLLDSMVSMTAALEAAETRISQDAMDRLARAAAYGARQHIADIVRSETRKQLVWLAGTIMLALGLGVIIGILLR